MLDVRVNQLTVAYFAAYFVLINPVEPLISNHPALILVDVILIGLTLLTHLGHKVARRAMKYFILVDLRHI